MTLHPEDLNPLQIDDKRLYSVGEAAIVISRDPSTIRAYIAARSIDGIRIGGAWKISGSSLKEFLNQNAPRKTFLEYPPGQLKFPQSSYLMQQMVVTNYNRPRIIDDCGKYGLLKPFANELDQLWCAVKETAPVRLRRQLRPGSKYVLDISKPETENWVSRLGIKDLFGHKTWPCQNILDDRSDKRLHIEVMLVGRITFKEIVNFMANKFNFIITEEQLDFFARHFFNTYNYNPTDRAIYLNRLEDRTEKFHKQKAWGDAEAARATLQIPSRVNFEETLNLIASMAALNFRDFAMGGPDEMPLCKDAAQMVFHSHRQLLALEKQRAEQVAVATQKAQDTGLKAEPFEKTADEPPSFEDLPQPEDEQEEPRKTKAG